MKTNNKLNSFQYYCIFLMPSLAQYSILGGKLDLDVIALLIVVLLMVKDNGGKARISRNNKLTRYILYTVLIVSFNILLSHLYVTRMEIILRSGRYCLYLVIAGMMLPEHVEYEEAVCIYRKVVFAALFYIILQYIVYLTTGFILPKKIGMSLRNFIGRARLSSFYSEPADMAYSLVPFICCALFGPQYRQKDSRFLDALLISFAIILSTSSQGTVVVLLLWGLRVLTGITKRRFNKNELILLVILVLIALVMSRFSLFDYSLSRLTGGTRSTAWAARSGGYTVFSNQGLISKFFGVGYGNYPSVNTFRYNTYGNYINFSSLSESLFTQGIFGTFLFFLFFFYSARNGNTVQRALIIAIAVLSIGGSPLTGKYIPIYFVIILCKIIETDDLEISEGSNVI